MAEKLWKPFDKIGLDNDGIPVLNGECTDLRPL